MLELVRRKSNALLLWGITGVYESQSVYTCTYCTCVSQYVHHHVCFDMLSFCQACGLLMWYVCLWIFVWSNIFIYMYLAWIDSVHCIAWTEFYSIKVTSVSLKSWTDKAKSAAGLFRCCSCFNNVCCIYSHFLLYFTLASHIFCKYLWRSLTCPTFHCNASCFCPDASGFHC